MRELKSSVAVWGGRVMRKCWLYRTAAWNLVPKSSSGSIAFSRERLYRQRCSYPESSRDGRETSTYGEVSALVQDLEISISLVEVYIPQKTLADSTAYFVMFFGYHSCEGTTKNLGSLNVDFCCSTLLLRLRLFRSICAGGQVCDCRLFFSCVDSRLSQLEKESKT